MTGLLLQILEEGELTDSTGRRVSFRNAVVVMTSNVGGQLRSEGLGFQPAGRENQTKQALRQHFSPEFLGRLDTIVHFSALSDEAMTGIAAKHLAQLKQRAAENGIRLTLPEELAQFLGSTGKHQGGARQIRRLVQEKVEGPLSVFLLRHSRKPAAITVTMQNGSLEFSS